MEGYLTSEQLAALLGIKPSSIYRYRVRGDIPPADEKLGRTPLWRQETIDAWLKDRPSSRWNRSAPNEKGDASK